MPTTTTTRDTRFEVRTGYAMQDGAAPRHFAVTHALPLTLLGVSVGLLAWSIRSKPSRSTSQAYGATRSLPDRNVRARGGEPGLSTDTRRSARAPRDVYVPELEDDLWTPT